MSAIKVGEILVKQGLLKPDQLAAAVEEQKKSGLRITNIIIQLGFLKENQILRALEKNYSVPGVEVNSFEIDPNVIAMIPRELCEKHTLVPLQRAGTTLVVAFADPSNIMVKEDLRFIARCRIHSIAGRRPGYAAPGTQVTAPVDGQRDRLRPAALPLLRAQGGSRHRVDRIVVDDDPLRRCGQGIDQSAGFRSEEHTSELQSH